MEDNIKDRLTRLETNMEWVKKQQYMLLGTQLSMIVALVLTFLRGA
jgi:hypothetical protein